MHITYEINACCFISQFLNIVISLASSERGPPIYATSHGAWSRDNEILRWAATETGRGVDLNRCRGYRVRCIGTRELLTNAEIDGIRELGWNARAGVKSGGGLIGLIGIKSWPPG